MKHFLELAHEKKVDARLGGDWTPGPTTWRHFSDVTYGTIAGAKRMGYLTKNTGIPMLTKKGYNKF